MKLHNIELETLEYLRTPAAIRQKCDSLPQRARTRVRHSFASRLFDLARPDKLRYFRVDLSQLDQAANYVIDTTRQQYPDFNIPFHSRWRHFEAGNLSRLAELDAAIAEFSLI